MSEEEFRAFQQTAHRFNAVQVGEDLYRVERPAVAQQHISPINHPGDSNLWLADEVTLVARRDIAPVKN